MLSPYFGVSVAVHNDIIVVGAPIGNDLKGSVYLYIRGEEGVFQLREKIRPPTLCSKAFFGWSVAFDGQRLIASAACTESIYIYQVNQDSRSILRHQDPLLDVYIEKSLLTNVLYQTVTDLDLPSMLTLNDGNLFLTNATGIHIYQQGGGVDYFEFTQFIEVDNFGDAYSSEYAKPLPSAAMNVLFTDYGEGYLSPTVIDDDLIAFAAGKILYVYSQSGDSSWEEAVRIESDRYANNKGGNATLSKGTIGISGRCLMFVVDDELMAYYLGLGLHTDSSNCFTVCSIIGTASKFFV